MHATKKSTVFLSKMDSGNHNKSMNRSTSGTPSTMLKLTAKSQSTDRAGLLERSHTATFASHIPYSMHFETHCTLYPTDSSGAMLKLTTIFECFHGRASFDRRCSVVAWLKAFSHVEKLSLLNLTDPEGKVLADAVFTNSKSSAPVSQTSGASDICCQTCLGTRCKIAKLLSTS